LAAGLPVYQPERFNTEETLHHLRDSGAELAVVVAYSAKIGSRALSLLAEGWLNLHPSLLPAYRGAAPLQWALIQGERRTGLSTFFLNEAWDAGPICLQEEMEIEEDECYGHLAERSAKKGAELVLRSLEQIAKGQVVLIPQDDTRATFAPLLTPQDSLLDWKQSATHIHNKVRGLSPQPGVFALFRNIRVQIERTESHPQGGVRDASPGEVVSSDRRGLLVGTGEGLLEIKVLRPENKRSICGTDFINGFRVQPGECFGKGVLQRAG
jgi:methionyl-tRNA formyltransferase